MDQYKTSDRKKLNERRLIKKTAFAVVLGFTGFKLSCTTASYLIESIAGAYVLLGAAFFCFLAYLLLMFLLKSNRKMDRYLNALMGAFIAVIMNNVLLRMFLFDEAEYQNRGLVGFYKYIFLLAAIFFIAGIIVTWINVKANAEYK